MPHRIAQQVLTCFGSWWRYPSRLWLLSSVYVGIALVPHLLDDGSLFAAWAALICDSNCCSPCHIILRWRGLNSLKSHDGWRRPPGTPGWVSRKCQRIAGIASLLQLALWDRRSIQVGSFGLVPGDDVGISMVDWCYGPCGQTVSEFRFTVMISHWLNGHVFSWGFLGHGIAEWRFKNLLEVRAAGVPFWRSAPVPKWHVVAISWVSVSV